MREFWKLLKSIKLAIVLIVVIGAGSILATLLPQGRSSRAYFGSALFLVPVALFFLNLSACTISRLRRELGKKTRRRHGPDILHLGLLLLIIGGIITSTARKEGLVMLAAGESADLPGGEILQLISFEQENYADGRPKGWTSMVNVEKNGILLHSGETIQVNKPLRVGAVKLYQVSYSSDPTVVIRNAEGRAFELSRGQTFNGKNVTVFFMAIEHGSGTEPSAVLRIEEAGIKKTVQLESSGVMIGQYSLGLEQRLLTGIQAVQDPGYPFVFAALLLVGLGTTLTFAQKLRDMDKI